MSWALNLAHPKLLYENVGSTAKFVVPSVFQIILYFVLLGICASEYLCPNVSSLADFNGKNGGALVAVLLSWCNSSPDLFSNFVSWTSTSASGTDNAAALSVGEVLGACGIILCVVEGSIFMIMSTVELKISPLQRKSLLKDLVLVFCAISILTYICILNRVTLMNCVTMMSIYAVYLYSKIKSHKKDSIQVTEPPVELTSQALAENEDLQSDDDDDDDETFKPHIKPSLISALDFNNILDLLEAASTTSSIEENEEDLRSLTQTFSIASNSIRPATEPIPSLQPDLIINAPQSSPTAFGPYQDFPENRESDIERQLTIASTRSRMNHQGPPTFRKRFFTAFLPHLLNFRKKSLIDAILSIVTIPFIIILRLSCPQTQQVIEFNKSVKRYTYKEMDFIMLFFQSFMSPIFTMLILSCIMIKTISWSLIITATLVSSMLIMLVFTFHKELVNYNKFSVLTENSIDDYEFSNESSHGMRTVERFNTIVKFTFTSISIMNSILWITLLANALIEILEIYQKVTGVSEAILGLTIFAWGNSISDLISNIAMCKLYRKSPQIDLNDTATVATKFFLISSSSCIGGVLLNSMIGIGLSAFITMIFIQRDTERWWFSRQMELSKEDENFDIKFISSCFTILLQVIILCIVFNGPSFIQKYVKANMFRIGLLMCGLWAFATVINIFIETII